MLKEIKKGLENNPYNPGTCERAVYHTIAYLFTLHDYIKIGNVLTHCSFKEMRNGKQRQYSKKTIGNALITLMNDGYLKFESKTVSGEHIYIQKGQVKE